MVTRELFLASDWPSYTSATALEEEVAKLAHGVKLIERSDCENRACANSLCIFIYAAVVL